MEITVLVADSQRLFAEALGQALDTRADIHALDHHPTTGTDALEAAVFYEPDVTLVDYWMTNMEGPAVAAMLSSKIPDAKVLVLSWFHGSREVSMSISAGAVGFLPKSLGVDDVAEAIRRAHAGESPVFPEELTRYVRKIAARDEQAAAAWARLGKLTPREVEILETLAAGGPFAESAKRLNITSATLRTHVHRILDKTGTGSQMEALSLARRYGLIQR